jgi:hypothetical protein
MAVSTAMAMLFTLCLASNVSAQSAVAREYEIKAAYLYNFIKYIDWPAQGLPTGSDTITIGVIGGNPFGPALATLDGKMVKGRKLVIKEAVRLEDLPSCQIVFVSPSEAQRMQEILNASNEAKVLTVSEVEGFAARGGIINFIEERNKVRFEINAEAAKRKGFVISSELLKLAKVVKS